MRFAWSIRVATPVCRMDQRPFRLVLDREASDDTLEPLGKVIIQ